MSPTVERPKPPYQQIAADISARIEGGEYAEGDAIPSARQIASTWGVALATATKVHAQLRSDGLVEALPGVGTVVRTGADHGAQGRLSNVRRSGFIYAKGERAVISAAGLIGAPDHVAVVLGVDPGVAVARRERVVLDGDEPVSASTSWFTAQTAEAAPLLLTTDRIRNGTFVYAAEQTGRTLASGREEVAATPATREQADRLRVPEGSPILLSRNWFRCSSGDVIEYGESIRLPDRWSSYEFDLR